MATEERRGPCGAGEEGALAASGVVRAGPPSAPEPRLDELGSQLSCALALPSPLLLLLLSSV